MARSKALTGLTRKHAIQLLEHLDEVRVTRNDGEEQQRCRGRFVIPLEPQGALGPRPIRNPTEW